MSIPLPFERFSIDTSLHPLEVAQRLRDVTAPMRLGLRPPKGKEFQGSVGELDFKLMRAIRYRNSFVPVLDGRIEPTAGGGACVRVAMRPHRAVLTFMAAWFGFLAIFSVAIVVIMVVKRELMALALAPLPFFAFGYALVVGGFKLESGRSRERLEAVLDAESVVELSQLSRESATGWPIRWRDIRAAGALGWLWVLCYGIAGALGLYDWIIRSSGCTNQQAGDPDYICPGASRIFAVWGIFAAMMFATAIGIGPVRNRKPRLLVPIICAQILAIVALAWIAQDPAFDARHR